MTGAKRKKKSVLWSKMHTPHCEDVKRWCRKRLPILEWAPNYNLKENLLPDTVSGIMLAVQQVTQGTFALTSLISANAVERLVPQSVQNLTTQSNTSVLGLSDFEVQRISVAAAVSFLGGVIQIYAYVFENIKSVRLEALLLSLLSIVVLVLVKELNEQFKRKIKVVLPVDLVLIIAASFACYCTNMENTYGLEVVGHIPKGIPPPRAPPMNILSAVITEAFGVALVGYAASLALAQGSAKKFKYSVDDNQEFLAHGLSNVIPSFFFCIPSAAAMGRTAGLYSTGAKTQVACLISCILVLIVIYAVGPLLYWLPMCVLASIIVVGLKGMLIQFRDLKKYWNVDKIDWETLQQVKIISINNPLVFLNAKKFHTDLMNIIQKEDASNQPPDDISKAYMDCKDKSVDVSLVHCTASLIKAMKYRGNLDTEKPIFFESVPAAVSHIHLNKVS
ncbi:Anion exchange transporter [Tupaia chinensis]|uniref:Anion exchange transporter n=1 Tax=Tupaia chinensis TaxID=246437 RepID=L9JBC2_TUPCH|nr:Anion exchange transporter [Tupaia chinensis]